MVVNKSGEGKRREINRAVREEVEDTGGSGSSQSRKGETGENNKQEGWKEQCE